MDQKILDAFAKTYELAIYDPSIYERIQLVKDALYRRSYIEAFDSKEKLEAYIIRWSPSRALAYYHIFASKPDINALLSTRSNVLCIGGGAGAEIAALSRFPSVNVQAIDLGNWQPVTSRLAEKLNMNVEIVSGDALDLVPQILDIDRFNMITCLFTTNELVAQSKPKFVNLFKHFRNCKPGTLIVVIESAGSYSEVQIGTKKFPVYFLLHYTLTNAAKLWDLVDQTDSEWYRLASDLKYPFELQNMRYFLRVYKRNNTPA